MATTFRPSRPLRSGLRKSRIYSQTRYLSTVMFENVTKATPDPMQELKKITDADKNSKKVDLGAGVYRNEQGLYHEFNAIREAKRRLDKANIGHDYNPTTGIRSFVNAAARLLFGGENSAVREKRLASVQCVAGTGANRIGAAFLSRYYRDIDRPLPTVYLGVPAWGNYQPLFQNAGFRVETYPYCETAATEPDLQSILQVIKNAEEGSIFIFQGCCHNPTGLDYTKEQWTSLAENISARKHFALFDIAYQGFGSGSTDAPEVDVWAIRHFADQGINILACQSFSKNMGLYSERVGALHVVCKSSQIAENVQDQLRAQVRWEFSSAPAYGARLVEIILNNEVLQEKWRKELKSAAKRIENNRTALHRLLTQTYSTPGSWDHVIREKGLFSFTQLKQPHIDDLIHKHHVYLPPNGRINVAGLTQENLDRTAKAIDSVCRQ